MKGVRVDQAARTVRVAGGARGAKSTTRRTVRAGGTASGIISSTGVGGLTLGGGIGISRAPAA